MEDGSCLARFKATTPTTRFSMPAVAITSVETPMTIQIGQALPDIAIAVINGEEVSKSLMTDGLFSDRKVVMFAVPGAFTPTCSERHLPGYIQTFAAFKALDVEVYCLSVNDAYVMKAWAASKQVPVGLKMLADGNGVFTRALGLEMDGSAYGMGLRARRFALYAVNGIVRILNIESPGEFRVSSAETMLAAIST
jgi:glutaredoxin/glutathione-dependent peroxiredoxin